MSVNIVPTEDYVLFADKSKALSNLNKRMLLVLPLVVLFFAVSAYYAHGFSVPVHTKKPPFLVKHVQVQFGPITSAVLFGLPWFLAAEFGLLYWVQVRSFRKQAKPIVTLSSEGIAVDTLATHLGLIYWSEIEEVRSYTLIYRYVGIVPKNSAALAQRLGKKQSLLMSMNAVCVPLYKPFGIFAAPINIPQVYLPITVDELVAHIRTYQAAYQEEANQFHPGLGLPAIEGAWPPPPRSEQ